MERLRGKLTYANVMATIAVFIALGGGAYALSRGEVKSKHIAKDAVKAKHIDFGVRSIPMMATFNQLPAGDANQSLAPVGTHAPGDVGDMLTPERFTATGLRVHLLVPLAAGTRTFAFAINEGDPTALSCEISAGERTCESNARVRVPAENVINFRVFSNDTTEIDSALVGWRAVLP